MDRDVVRPSEPLWQVGWRWRTKPRRGACKERYDLFSVRRPAAAGGQPHAGRRQVGRHRTALPGPWRKTTRTTACRQRPLAAAGQARYQNLTRRDLPPDPRGRAKAASRSCSGRRQNAAKAAQSQTPTRCCTQQSFEVPRPVAKRPVAGPRPNLNHVNHSRPTSTGGTQELVTFKTTDGQTQRATC